MDATTNIESRVPDRRLAKGLELSLRRTRNHASPNIAEIFKKTPCVAGLKPAGRDVAKHLLDIGIVPLPIKTLRNCSTVYSGGNLTDKKLSAHPSKLGRCATNHASGTLRDDAHLGGAHENQCYADV